MSSCLSWQELRLRTPFGCSSESAVNRSIDVVGMIMLWLYTGERALWNRRKVIWIEVPHFLAHFLQLRKLSRIQSGQWDWLQPCVWTSWLENRIRASPLFPPAVCCSSVPNQLIICFISLLTDSACLCRKTNLMVWAQKDTFLLLQPIHLR